MEEVLDQPLWLQESEAATVEQERRKKMLQIYGGLLLASGLVAAGILTYLGAHALLSPGSSRDSAAALIAKTR